LTLLLTVFVFVSLMANLLAKVGEANIVGAGFLVGSIAESLAPFALGTLVCAVLYAPAAFSKEYCNAEGHQGAIFWARAKNQALSE